jgi:hypothetical protein
LSEAARRAIEMRMSQGEYQYQSEFARTYFAQGEVKTTAELFAPPKRPTKTRRGLTCVQ